MKSLRLHHLGFVAMLLLPTFAFAHPGHDGHEFGWDFRAGIAHPLLGWDHLAAMVAVGLWAARLGGRARWLVPGAFLTLMIGGAALAQSGVTLSGVEPAIGASVLVFGLLIASARRIHPVAGASLAGLFAVFHGYAHVVEAPRAALAGYASGFLVATALIHLAGYGLGVWAGPRSVRLMRAAGAAVAAGGLVLLVT